MRALLLLASVALAQVAGAQVSPAARRGNGGVTVYGMVHDSVARQPLARAIVQLVSADSASATPRSVTADSGGRYRFDDVARGRYLIGFFHPMLDSLTLQPPLRELWVGGNIDVPFDLAIPSGLRLRTAFCGAAVPALVGVVRNPRDATPVSGAKVIAEWMDLIVGKGRNMASRPSHLVATTAGNGWFALCGVPGPGALNLRALSGSDSSDRVDIQMPPDGFLRRELYVAPTRSMTGRLNGTVMTDEGKPIDDAIVSIGPANRTRTNAQGEWALAGLPLGTRTLEVRAIGFYPDRRAVDVVREPGFVTVAMATFKSVLDTVRIRASAGMAPDGGGFDYRRKALGTGKFLTEEDIRRRVVIQTSDLFKAMPGMRLEGDIIKMRGAFSNIGEMGDCAPTVFIDGRPIMPMTTPDSDAPKLKLYDLDMWVRPSEIFGIEVYHDAPPPQFQAPMSGCGSIVIWTKRLAQPRKP